MFGTAFIAEHSWMPGIFSLWRVMCWDGIFCLDFCRASWKYRNSNVFGFSQVFNSIPLCLRALTSILMWVLPNWITNRITSLWLCVRIKRLDPVKAVGVCWIVHGFFSWPIWFFFSISSPSFCRCEHGPWFALFCCVKGGFLGMGCSTASSWEPLVMQLFLVTCYYLQLWHSVVFQHLL